MDDCTGIALDSFLLAAVEDGRWKPGIGDPTVLGWVTVVAYLVAALCCFRAAWREVRTDNERPIRPATFWLVLCGLLVALGINKQLDLQSLLTQIGRDVFRAHGIYNQRRVYQVGFIALVALLCGTAIGAFFWASRRVPHARWLAFVGVTFIFGFVVVRAASFHHVDMFLAARIGGMRWNWVLELGGITAVAVSAFRVSPRAELRPRRAAGSTTYHYRVNPP
jgi:hypothetical protein